MTDMLPRHHPSSKERKPQPAQDGEGKRTAKPTTQWHPMGHDAFTYFMRRLTFVAEADDVHLVASIHRCGSHAAHRNIEWIVVICNCANANWIHDSALSPPASHPHSSGLCQHDGPFMAQHRLELRLFYSCGPMLSCSYAGGATQSRSRAFWPRTRAHTRARDTPQVVGAIGRTPMPHRRPAALPTPPPAQSPTELAESPQQSTTQWNRRLAQREAVSTAPRAHPDAPSCVGGYLHLGDSSRYDAATRWHPG